MVKKLLVKPKKGKGQKSDNLKSTSKTNPNNFVLFFYGRTTLKYNTYE